MQTVEDLIYVHADHPAVLLSELEDLLSEAPASEVWRIGALIDALRPVVEKRERLQRELEATTERLERARAIEARKLSDIAERAARDSERVREESRRQSAYAAQLRGWIAGVKFDPPKRLLR